MSSFRFCILELHTTPWYSLSDHTFSLKNVITAAHENHSPTTPVPGNIQPPYRFYTNQPTMETRSSFGLASTLIFSPYTIHPPLHIYPPVIHIRSRIFTLRIPCTDILVQPATHATAANCPDIRTTNPQFLI